MKKEVVIDSSRYETRIAILENGELSEIYIERGEDAGLVGNIYLGKVGKVLPGIQSAFVNIGLEKDAFLHCSDISYNSEIYENRVKVNRRLKGGKNPTIETLVKSGQSAVVQITKEPLSAKGARITSFISLPGRYLVYMPSVRHLGVSKKIPSREERKRLRLILAKHKGKNDGFIVRTAGEGKSEADLKADMDYLTGLWDEIKTKAGKVNPPILLHRDFNLTLRVLRDYLSSDMTRIVINTKEAYDEVVNFIKRIFPRYKGKIQLYESHLPVFEKFGIQDCLDRSLEDRVWLKSGGHIVVSQTEALVAIDVNTGRYVGDSSKQENTVVQTNLDAVSEVVKQLRLRDLGGIIVVDFIDMEEAKNRKRVIDAFREELKKDKAQSKILQISDFGLVEMTRKRTRNSLSSVLCSVCPYCDGAGHIKSDRTISYEIRREVIKRSGTLSGKKICIKANPDILHILKSEQGLIEELTDVTGKNIYLKGDPNYHNEQYDITEG